jgi:hypothetical protein
MTRLTTFVSLGLNDWTEGTDCSICGADEVDRPGLPCGARRALEALTDGFLQSDDKIFKISMRIEKVDIVGRWLRPSASRLPAPQNDPKMNAYSVFTQAEINIEQTIIAVNSWLLDKTRLSFRTVIRHALLNKRITNGSY